MGKKRHNEWITQYKITTRLNKITAPNKNREEKERLRKELRNLTHGFWFRKFIRIRQILHSRSAAEDKCHKIEEILDTPFDPWKRGY